MFALLLLAAGWFAIRNSVADFSAGYRLLAFNRTVFITAMLLSMPTTVLLFLPVRMLMSGSGKRVFWIKHPARTIEEWTDEPLDKIGQTARQRLDALGFTVHLAEESPDGARILFTKPKAEKVVRFVDHAFDGELVVRRASGRNQLSATVVFRDIVLVESGESERLAALARYLAGATTDLQVAILPFTMLCGVVIAALNLALLPVDGLRPWLGSQQLSIALAAVGLILFGGFPILRNRGENYGLPLGVLGLTGAVLPLLLA